MEMVIIRASMSCKHHDERLHIGTVVAASLSTSASNKNYKWYLEPVFNQQFFIC